MGTYKENYQLKNRDIFMKKFTLLLPLLCSCQWLLIHPEIIPEAEQVGEAIIKDFEAYESGRILSPSQPPLKGPSGPTKR